MIAAHGLTRQFGRIVAVDELDFEIPRGQVVGFLGPNGAGKTTTIRMITGFLPPTRGTVLVDGLSVAEHRQAVSRRIGYLPEATPLYTEMRVVEFLRLRARLFGIPPSRRKAAIEQALRRCWLTDVRRRPIHQLSKGYRQRVGLAAALLHEPPVLILDEPTVGLDPAQIRESRSLIRELAGEHTVLLSTHILSEVELTCDRVMMISRGRIRAQGSIAKLKAEAASHDRYVIELATAASTEAAESVRRLVGVSRVDANRIDDHWQRLIVTADDTSDLLRDEIARVLQRHHAVVRELSRPAPSLEHLFIELMTRDDDANAAAEPEGREK